MALNIEAARVALAELGGRTGLSAEAAAAGIIQVANANIDRAVRRVSVARGYDPRDFTLVAFGGAGPLHACEVAERLDIPRVLLPRYPGVMCALGLLVADVALEYSRSILQPLTDEMVERIAAHLASMREIGADDLIRESIPADRQQFRPLLDMRYAGQAYELTIPLSLEAPLTTDGLAEAFHAAHQRAYGHALRGRAIEAVNVRLQAVGITDKPAFEPEAIPTGNSINMPRPEGQKDAVGVRISLFDRDSLRPGDAFDGRALAFQLDSTAYIPAGWRARVDVYRNLIIERL
jgi:N-methylhydantoinase A